ERFAERYEIGLQAQRLEIEGVSGAAQAALDLVGNQERAGFRARLGDRLGELAAERANAAFALHGLGNDRRGFRRYGGQQSGRVAVRDPFHARKQRLERLAIVLVGRDRQRTKGTAVERLFERDDLRPRLALRVPVTPRELQT